MKDFRKYINQVANQHKEDVDNDALWAGIQEKMEKPKKRRPIFPLFIWGISLLVISLVGISLYTFSEKNKSHLGHNPLVSANDLKSSNDQPTTEIKSTKKEQPKKEIDASIDSDLVEIVKNRKKSIAESSRTSISANDNKSPTINTQSRAISAYDFPTDPKDLNNKKTTLNFEKIQTQFSTGQRKRKGVSNLLPIKTSLNILFFNRSKININLDFESPIPQYSNNNEDFSFFNSLTFYTQYGSGSKSILANSDYAQLRNQSEELMEQIRLGIESDLVNFHDFTFYGGVSFMAINIKVDANENYYEDREITYLKSKRILSDGSVIEKFAKEDLPHLINSQSVRYNTNKLISMPFGIRFGRSFSKIQLSVGFGLDINYGLSDEHTIVGNKGRLTSIPIEGKWFDPSFHSTFTVEYPIFERWFLHSKLMYRNITLEHTYLENSLEEKYKLYGIDLGVKFEF